MSLIHWWPLTEDLNDKIGNNPLQFYNTTSDTIITANANGKIGACYERTQTNTIDALRSKNKIKALTTQSICAWVYFIQMNSVDIGTANGVVTNHNHSTNSGLGIGVYSTDGNACYISINAGTGTGRIHSSANYRGTTDIKNAWHHICITYDIDNKIRLYVDGNEDMSARNYDLYSPSDYFDVFNWSIGHVNNARYRPMCKINDVRIYDHALSLAEIQELKKALVVHYTFDDLLAENTTNLLPANLQNKSVVGTTSDAAFYKYKVTENGGSYTITADICRETDDKRPTPYFSMHFSQADKNATTDAELMASGMIHGGVSTTIATDGVALTEAADGKFHTYTLTLDTAKATKPINWVCGWLLDRGTYTNQYRNEKIKNAQLEHHDHSTPYTPTSRTGLLCNEAGYPTTNSINDVECVSTAAIGERAVYCKNGLQRITSTVNQCASDVLTASAWFKSTNKTPKNNYHIVIAIDSGVVEISVPNNGQLRWGGYNKVNNSTTVRFCSNANANLLDGQWHLLTIVYDGSGWLGYVDGVYKGKHTEATVSGVKYTCNGPIAYSNKKLTIGRYYDDATSSYGATDAYIDDVRIYNSVLSPKEIKELYNCGGRISNLGDALTGSFIESETVTKVNKNHTITTNEIYEQILPDGYQQLEWIETDGTAYINTGYNSSAPYQIDCDMEITGSTLGNYWFGQQQNSNRMLYNGFYSSTSLEFNWLTVSAAGTRKIMTQTLINSTQINITINGISTIRDIGTNGQGGDLYIFACRYPDNTLRTYRSKMKLYSFKIHEGSNYIRDFIPARNSDGVLGLYDIIHNQFYTNAGSGNFIAGPTITTGQASILREGGLTAREIIEI